MVCHKALLRDINRLQLFPCRPCFPPLAQGGIRVGNDRGQRKHDSDDHGDFDQGQTALADLVAICWVGSQGKEPVGLIRFTACLYR